MADPKTVSLLTSIFNFFKSYVGDIASILGLVLSVWIFFRTGNINKKLMEVTKIKQFKTDKRTIVAQLISDKDLIVKDNILDLGVCSDISEQLSRLSHYKDLIKSKECAKDIEGINNILKHGLTDENKSELVLFLSRLIGFLDTRIIETNQNLV